MNTPANIKSISLNANLIIKSAVLLCAVLIQASCTQKSLEECKEIMHQCDVYGSIAGDPMAKFKSIKPLNKSNILKAENFCGQAVELCPANGRMQIQYAESISRLLAIKRNQLRKNNIRKSEKIDLIKQLEVAQAKMIKPIKLAAKYNYPMGYFYNAALAKAYNNEKSFIVNMKKAADLMVPSAQAKMAGYYFRGYLVSVNFKLASDYAKLSHKNNDLDGTNILAYFYLYGIGVVKNHTKSEKLLRELLKYQGNVIKKSIQNIKLSLSLINFEKGLITKQDLLANIKLKKKINDPYVLINFTKAYDLTNQLELRDQTYCKIKKELREKIFPNLTQTNCKRFLKWMR